MDSAIRSQTGHGFVPMTGYLQPKRTFEGDPLMGGMDHPEAHLPFCDSKRGQSLAHGCRSRSSPMAGLRGLARCASGRLGAGWGRLGPVGAGWGRLGPLGDTSAPIKAERHRALRRPPALCRLPVARDPNVGYIGCPCDLGQDARTPRALCSSGSGSARHGADRAQIGHRQGTRKPTRAVMDTLVTPKNCTAMECERASYAGPSRHPASRAARYQARSVGAPLSVPRMYRRQSV
jgi:hypothetical protein